MKKLSLFGYALVFSALVLVSLDASAGEPERDYLDGQLRGILANYRFTGKVEATLQSRLGRPLNPTRAELGPRFSSTNSLACMGTILARPAIRR